VRDLYSKDAGRPSYPPKVMFKILFLEFYYNLSDVEVVKQLKFNVLFRYFAGLKAEDALPDDTSLVVFRKRLGEERFETRTLKREISIPSLKVLVGLARS